MSTYTRENAERRARIAGADWEDYERVIAEHERTAREVDGEPARIAGIYAEVSRANLTHAKWKAAKYADAARSER